MVNTLEIRNKKPKTETPDLNFEGRKIIINNDRRRNPISASVHLDTSTLYTTKINNSPRLDFEIWYQMESRSTSLESRKV